MRNTADPGTVSPLYEHLDKQLRLVYLRLTKLRIEAGTYNEVAAMPTVVDRIMKELHDGNE